MRKAHTLIEMMTAVAVLGTILVITTQALAGGLGMRDTIAARGDSDEQVARLVKDVIQDLRYADINRIYLDANNSPSWYQSGSTGDFYSFKTCTGFNTAQASVPSMSRLIKYDQGVVLHYQQNPADPTKGQLSRKVYQLDSSGITTGVLQPDTVISNNLAWSYVSPDAPTTVKKGFEITQMVNSGTTVTGNRLNVVAAIRPASATKVETSSTGVPVLSPTSAYSSSVFLRSTLFDQFGVLPPVITSTLTATGYVGTAFRYDVKATNFPTSYIANPLPAGLTFDFRQGILSGTPTTAVNTNIVLTAQNQVGTDSKVLVVTVKGAIPAITSPVNATALAGQSFSYQIQATNLPLSYSATGMPAGLTIANGSGILSGTATQLGTYSVTLGATNANGTGTLQLTLVVSSTPPPAPVVTSATTTVATLGQVFTFQIQASNSPTSFAALNLPAGFGCAVNSGLISGTPTTAGTFNSYVNASNAAGTGNGALTITVQAPIPVITSESVSATVGTSLAYTIKATNSPTSYTSTNSPTWLTAPSNSGVISGTPTVAGTFNVNLAATNSYGTGTGTVSIVVANLTVPQITSVTTASATAGVMFSYQTLASNQPTSFAISNKPSWLSLNASSGLLTGSNPAQSTYTVSLSANNAVGAGPATTVTFNVGAASGQPSISFSNNLNTNGTFQVIGTINAASGDQINMSSFASTIPAGFTLNRSSWPNGTFDAGPLTFVVSGSTIPSGLLTLTASAQSKSSNLTGTGTRNY